MDWTKGIVDKDVGGDSVVEDDELMIVETDICVVSVATILDEDVVELMVFPNVRLVEVDSMSLVLVARTWSGDELCTIDAAGATVAVVDDPRFKRLHIFLNTTLVVVAFTIPQSPNKHVVCVVPFPRAPTILSWFVH